MATILLCTYIFVKVILFYDEIHIAKFSMRHLPAVLTIIIETMLFNY